MMEHYRKLIDKLTCEIGMHRQEDGFQSPPLREKILSELRQLPVPEPPAETARRCRPSANGCRLPQPPRFSDPGRRIGGAIARAQIQEELPLPASHYLYDMVLAGADALGREIARGYAVELYPELVRLREQKIELPLAVPGREPGTTRKAPGSASRLKPRLSSYSSTISNHFRLKPNGKSPTTNSGKTTGSDSLSTPKKKRNATIGSGRNSGTVILLHHRSGMPFVFGRPVISAKSFTSPMKWKKVPKRGFCVSPHSAKRWNSAANLKRSGFILRNSRRKSFRDSICRKVI